MQIPNQSIPSNPQPPKISSNPAISRPTNPLLNRVLKDEVVFSGRKDRLKREQRESRQQEKDRIIAENAEKSFRIAIQNQPILADFLANQQAHPDSDLLALQILKMGAFPNSKSTRFGYPPIAIATGHRQPAVLKALLKAGADPNVKSKDSGETALQVAVDHNNWKMAEYLLDNGANPEAKNVNKDSPLVDTATCGNTNLVQKMLNMGANPNAKDSIGNPILLTAAALGHKDMAKLLLDYGADPNLQDSQGVTPLHFAVADNYELARLLLQKGADPRLQGNDGLSPLDFAHISEDPGMGQLLNRFIPHH